jgi:hypothetical protein
MILQISCGYACSALTGIIPANSHARYVLGDIKGDN